MTTQLIQYFRTERECLAYYEHATSENLIIWIEDAISRECFKHGFILLGAKDGILFGFLSDIGMKYLHDTSKE